MAGHRVWVAAARRGALPVIGAVLDAWPDPASAHATAHSTAHTACPPLPCATTNNTRVNTRTRIRRWACTSSPASACSLWPSCATDWHWTPPPTNSRSTSAASECRRWRAGRECVCVCVCVLHVMVYELMCHWLAAPASVLASSRTWPLAAAAAIVCFPGRLLFTSRLPARFPEPCLRLPPGRLLLPSRPLLGSCTLTPPSLMQLQFSLPRDCFLTELVQR